MKKILLTATIIAIGFGANAQSMFGIHYPMGIPMGATKDHLSQASFRGIGLEGRYFVTDNLTIGMSFDWQVFYEEEGPQTFNEEVDFDGDGTPVTVYGKKYKYINALPMMVTGYYHFGEDGELRPYIGTGIGVANMIQRSDLGLFSSDKNTWNFAMTPEVGVLIPINFNTALTAAVTYNWALKANDSITYSWLTFKVGFAFM